jgi:hypothetical protein
MDPQARRRIAPKKALAARRAAAQAKPEDQLVAVIWAMSDQLHADGHPLNPAKVMGTDYGYTSDSMQGFLGGIHGRLAWHDPKYRFDFDTAFGDAAVALTVGELTGKINDKTTPA